MAKIRTIDKKRLALLRKQISACKAVIGSERDKLREIKDELDSICDSCDRADEGLETAIDALSEYL